MSGALRLAAALALSFTSVACGPRDEVVEASRVLRLVEGVRGAEAATPDERDELIDALERDGAKTAPAKAAREACVAAFRPLVVAKRKTAEGEKGMKDRDVPAAAVVEAVRAAGAALKDSEAKMPACDAATTTLRKLADGHG